MPLETVVSPLNPPFRRTSFHRAMLLALGQGASALALLASSGVNAGDILRGNGVASPVANIAAQQTAAMQQAQRAARQANNSLARATQALQAMRAAQDAARDLALNTPSTVPNGLKPGGLVVAPGAVPSETDGGTGLWQGADLPTQTQDGNRTQVEVKQNEEKAILTWESFNVGRETDLHFDQTAGGGQASEWIALNRVLDSSTAPSKILGNIEAEGSVYLINTNGIIFGGASQVNVHSLTASGLNIALEGVNNDTPVTSEIIAQRNQKFLDGLLSMTDETNPPVTFGEDGIPWLMPGEEFAEDDGVIVEAGAHIQTGNYGQTLLLGHTVINNGIIETPDGQALLVAGRSVTLNKNYAPGSYTPIDPDLRGYTVGVDRGGVVTNSGIISADRGNVTLTGKHVQQNGAIVATTGAEANGSILLMAAEGVRARARPLVDGNFGHLTLGPGSVTTVLPDDSGVPVIGTGGFRSSKIDLVGNQIAFEEGSALYAPGARLNITADRPAQQNPAPEDDGIYSRIYLDEGAVIDISGLHVESDVGQNSIEAELRANELRDNPLLRDGPLRGRSVWFDPRRGTEVADLSGYYDLIERDVAEHMTAGGTLTMSGMDIIAREGSLIDLSGGSVFYQGGSVRSTRLIDADGHLVPIEMAGPNELYVGIEGDFIVNHGRWGVMETYTSPLGHTRGRYEAAYTEGRSAGSLILDVNRVTWGAGGYPVNDAFRIFEGEVKGDVTVGKYQREAPTGGTVADVERVWRERPKGGTLVMGGQTNATNNRDATNLGGNITIGDPDGLLPEGFEADTGLDYSDGYQHVLPEDWFDGDTFSDVTLYSGVTTEELNYHDDDLGERVEGPAPVAPAGILTVAEGVTLDLGDYGAFTFYGTQANIDGTLRAPGGSVWLETVQAPTQDSFNPTNNWADIPKADRPRISLGATGVIDVAGTWVNHYLDGASNKAPVLDGGAVALIGYSILLEEGSLVTVDGGGHLSADMTLTAGDGGSILIDNSVRYANADPFPVELPGTGSLVLDGRLTGYALGEGGSLSIDTPYDVIIGGEPVLEEGVLEAGEAAPRNLPLAQDLQFVAGDILPIDRLDTIDHLNPGVALASEAYLRSISPSDPLVVEADWTVPSGIAFYDAGYQNYYTEGEVIPAGTELVYSNNRALPAGYVLPADAFPSGIALNAPADIRLAAGTVLTSDLTIPLGTLLPEGLVLDRTVEIVPPRHFSPDFFTEGGFSSYALSGALGVTVMSDTVIAPSTETIMLDDAGRDIASGTRLAAAGRLEVLPEELRGPLTLSLSTAAIDLENESYATRVTGEVTTRQASINPARNPGDVVIETGAEIRLDPESTVLLNSYVGDVFVDGIIETKAGRIALQTVTNDESSTQGLRLGANARLLAPGYVDTVPDGRDGRREVEAGGDIELGGIGNNNRGLDYLLIDDGAVLDVSGIHAEADFLPAGEWTPGDGKDYVSLPVDGAAGSILIQSLRGVVGGDFRMAPGGETGHGGDLSIVARPEYGSEQRLIVHSGTGSDMPAVEADTPIDPDLVGLTVFEDRLSGSGADNLTLRADGEENGKVLFDGDVSLTTRRSLQMVTSTIGKTNNADTRIELESAWVRLGTSGLFRTNTSLSSGPDLAGELIVQADLIDIDGRLLLGCAASVCADVAAEGSFAETHLIAAGDIRLNAGTFSQRRASSPPPGLFSGGEIIFDAAQVYMTSRVQDTNASNNNMHRPPEFPGFLVEAAERIEIRGNGAPAPVPMSFGERLTLRAPEIVQGGVLRVPQGEIRFEASESVTLLPGSLTSVSLEGLVVPFGYVDTNGGFAGYLEPGETPVKSVRMDAPDISVEDGAVLDVSGGGDLLGLSFAAGNGGSTNILAYNDSMERFAILPSLGTAPAPINDGGATSHFNDPRGDGLALDDPRLSVGDTIWLEGVPGLAAGYYTLLPAFYAVLEGGMLIEPVDAGHAAPLPLMERADGAVVTSGYRAVSGTPIRDAGYDRFAVMDQGTFGQHSDLTARSFNEYAKNLGETAGIVARTPFDAGSVILGATATLHLDGEGRFGADDGGLLGNLDVSAQSIAVVEGGTDAPEGFMALDAGQLSDFGAASILIGGVRDTGVEGTEVTVNAQEVTVANNEGSPLAGQEIILAAKGGVTVEDGAVILGEGKGSLDPNTLFLDGDGALLRVSSADRVGIVRSGASGAAGDLSIGENVRMIAGGSLTLDAAHELDLAETAILTADQLDLAAVAVNLGAAPEGTPGLTLSSSILNRLSASSDLLIRGHNAINIFGGLQLGARGETGDATLGALTLDTMLLQGQPGEGEDAGLTVGTLTLRNSGDAAAAPISGGGGLLALDVDRLILGPGEVDLAGYGRIEGTGGRLEVQGGGGLDVAGDFSLATGLVTAATAADYGLRAEGSLALTQGETSDDAVDALGGRLVVSGSDVRIDTRIALPAGVFEATSPGALEIGESARLDLAGEAVDFHDVVEFAPGGTVRLTVAGALRIAEGAVVDVSGSERGGGAGRLAIEAGGNVLIAGTLLGDAHEDYDGGSIDLDAGSVDDFATLNALLNDGGFNAEREIRLRQQAITLAADETISAHRVALRSDTGRVTIAGTIDATGTAASPNGGIIRLEGGNGVVLGETARLDARAAETPEGDYPAASGKVEIAATGGRVDVASGALVDISGGQRGGGTVTVRAPRDGAGIAVDRLAGDFVGALDKVLLGTSHYEAAVVDAGLVATMLADASSWLAGAPAFAGWSTGAGMVVRSADNMRVSGDIDLHALTGPGHLGLIAGGDLTIDATINDGFAATDRDAALMDMQSASYSFESAGDITLAADAMVRTGTGDIRLDAGRDLVLDNTRSVVYTAGRKTATEAGFDPASTDGRPLGEFPTLGGDIAISAGRDILAPLTEQSNSAWLFRYGSTDWTGDTRTSTVVQQTSWSIVFKNFEQGIGALGGGNVRVDAGRDVEHLAVSVPTTGHMTTPAGEVAEQADLHVRGGGDVGINVGRDLLGGVFMLGQGEGEVRVGGDVIPSDQLALLRNNLNTNHNGRGWVNRQVGALFGLMDAEATVTAVGTVDIEAAYDPMRQGQICENFTACTGQGTGSAFYGYSDRAALNAMSVSGSITYRDNPWASTDLTRGQGPWQVLMYTPSGGDPRPRLNNIFGELPGTLRFASLKSSIYLEPRFAAPFTLAPAPEGTVEFLAQGNVRIPGGTTGLVMRDIAPEYRRGALRPFSIDVVGFMANTQPQMGVPSATNNYHRGFDLLHGDDTEPARIYSLEGSICNAHSSQAACQSSSVLNLPKPLYMVAGEDIRLQATFQHNRPGAISYISAGRDLVYPEMTVTGEGDLMLEAGRDVIKTTSFTVSHIASGVVDASARNLALPSDRGANITILAGSAQGADWDGFADVYLDPDNSHDVVHAYLPELAEFMAELGYEDVAPEELKVAFDALPQATRQTFLQQVFFTELKETGIDYNDPESPRFQQYSRGYDAVERLFTADPATVEEGGDIILANNPVETREGGDITMLAPYGSLEVGSLYPLASFDPNNSGIVTRRGGDVRIMTDGNIDLYTSRVFTLQGGDITMWTSNGSITAGAGAKTSVRQTPLQYVMSNDGFVEVDVFGLQTGAGIGVLDALDGRDEDRERSRMDLMAFRGEVNAGDAGIRVVGDLNIAALRVIGLDNIQVVDGTATGVPEAAQPQMNVSLNVDEAAKEAASEAMEAATRQASRRQALPSIITVEVLGYGGGDGNEESQSREREAAPYRGTRSRPRYNPDSAVRYVGAGPLTEAQKRQLVEDRAPASQ